MSLDNATHRISHRIRMEIKAKANNRRLFFGENGNPLILCSRRIDKGGPGQCYIKMSLFKTIVLLPIDTLTGSSVVASWTSTLKGAGSNLHDIFIFSH